MSGEAIRDYGAWVNLETSGASISNNAFVAASVAMFSTATDGGNRPHIEVELQFAYATAPTAFTAIVMHHSAQNLFGGTNSARDPSANNVANALAGVQVDATTSTQYARFDVMFAPDYSKYWLQNAGTGQAISAGWQLRARGWTLKAAP